MHSNYYADESRSLKIHLIICLISQLFLGASIIITSSIYWIRYCVFYYGLYAVDDIYSNADFDDDSISDIQDDCDDDSYDDYKLELDDGGYAYINVNLMCDGFCDNIDDLKSGSDTMIVFTAFTLVFLALNMTVVLVRIIRPGFRPKYIPFILGGLTFMTYLIGICLYLGLGNFGDYDDCQEYSDEDCYDFSVRAGLVLGIINVVAIFGNSLYAFFFTRKAFMN